jgi:16S rRNA (cytidine1402-2'-O)-methyltransferase
MASLYIVATPIGNLEDITLRALRVLREVEYVACEDTRRTGKLLAYYEIKSRLLSVRSQNEEREAQRICSLLEEGCDVAYASDAGTPGVSDPGRRLVDEARRAGHAVIPLPGASAWSTLMSVSPFPGRTVTFDGFLSPKAGKRRSRLDELLGRGEAFLLYESPHRIVKILADVAEKEPERAVLVGREMTKLHEEFLEGSAAELHRELEGRKSLKGEFALLVSGRKKR